MELQRNSELSGSSYVKSWTAYIRPFVAFLVFESPGAGFIYSSWLGRLSVWLGVAFMVCMLVVFVLRALTIRSVVLCTNEQGVWVFSGIFPWSKGYAGVKWRDLDDAGYFPNFFSWLFRSYSIRVAHRFTKSSEIYLDHVKRGHDAVTHINAYHQQILMMGPKRSVD